MNHTLILHWDSKNRGKENSKKIIHIPHPCSKSHWIKQHISQWTNAAQAPVTGSCALLGWQKRVKKQTTHQLVNQFSHQQFGVVLIISWGPIQNPKTAALANDSWSTVPSLMPTVPPISPMKKTCHLFWSAQTYCCCFWSLALKWTLVNLAISCRDHKK